MTTKLQTPILDSALDESPKNERYAVRFDRAKKTLEAGLAVQSIYNAELDDAKYHLGYAIEAALEHIIEPLQTVRRHSRNESYMEGKRYIDVARVMFDLVSSYCQLNQAAGRAKRLRDLPTLMKKYPLLTGYVLALDEIAMLNKAVTDLKPVIIKGRKPSENPKPVDLTNTGTCSICMHLQKLTAAQHMVHHGFQISNGMGQYLGFRSGRCFGCSYKPYELSNEGNIAYEKALQTGLQNLNQSLEDLKTGKVTMLSHDVMKRVNGVRVYERVEVRPGEKEWARTLELEIHTVEGRISTTKFMIEQQQLLIKTWTPKPLPGDRK